MSHAWRLVQHATHTFPLACFAIMRCTLPNQRTEVRQAIFAGVALCSSHRRTLREIRAPWAGRACEVLSRKPGAL